MRYLHAHENELHGAKHPQHGWLAASHAPVPDPGKSITGLEALNSRASAAERDRARCRNSGER
jgi:hypothetical protein